MTERIQLNHICKVEGHADLAVDIKDGKITRCELGAVEGARFFEGLVVGRKWDELKEITSRICGICSVSHSMTSIKAVEDAFGMTPSTQTKLLRELMTIGERIRSHATHLYLLSLPDFVGCESAIEMAPKYKKELARALHLIKLGNEMVIRLSGRQMHPVASVVGGFTKVPEKEDVVYLKGLMKDARKEAVETLKLFLSLKYPDVQRDVEHVSVYQEGALTILDGIIVSDQGLRVEPRDYGGLIEEYVVPYSATKFAGKEGKDYMLGAIARLNNAWAHVADDLKLLVNEGGHAFPSKNPFHNLIAQAVELAHWVDLGERMLKELNLRPEPLQTVKPRAGKGVGITEAPRGLLFHEYHFDDQGTCTECRIMTPTSQFIRAQEAYVKEYVQQLLDAGKGKEVIVSEIEKLIRAFDPCFSCSAHFLNVDWHEE